MYGMSDSELGIPPDTPVLACDNKYLSGVSRLLETTDEMYAMRRSLV